MRRALVLAALLAAAVLAGSARADGDPASDYLLGTQVFIPFDMKLSKPEQQELTSVVKDANASGYKIRVALIGSAYDLGAVTSLWRKPRPYARFLDAEINFVYKQRLLIVMPNGFGFAWPKHPSAQEYAVLAKVPVGPGTAGMLASTVTAVQKLAAASGIKVAPSKAAAAEKSGGGGFLHSRTLIVLAAVAGLAILVLLRLALRRKSP